MEFGKAVHSGLEVLYSKDGDVDRAVSHALSLYEEGLKRCSIEHPSDLEEAHRIKPFIRRFYEDCLTCPDLMGITTLRSELELMEPIDRLDGLNLMFKGFIDIVFVKKLKRKKVIYVSDFKTCQWGWPAKKLQDEKVISQILLYKHFFCKMTGMNPRDVSIAFILLKKAPRRISAADVDPPIFDSTAQVVKIPAGPKAMQRAIQYMQDTISLMHSYSYELNESACERSWIDQTTKQERSVSCRFFRTDHCPVVGQTS